MGIYESLGVRTFINASGTVTRLGGSLMPPEVLDAMKEAAQSFVNLDELHEKVGRRIAELIGCEAAYVCSGAAGGLTLSAAACIAGKDQEKIRQLPNSNGMKNEIIIHKSHRNGFDQAVRQAGAKLIEVGSKRNTSVEDVEAAINERTAAIVYFIAFVTKVSVSLKDIVALAKGAGVPVIVDAAAELPPASNLRRFTDMGVELVIFSGGKGLMGPQSTGLILGCKDLISACALNANPNYSIGRPMKVGKEETIGLLKAVELYVERDHKKDLQVWGEQIDYIIEAISNIPSITAERLPTNEWSPMPVASITFDESCLKMTKCDVIDQLRNGCPSIEVRETGKGFSIYPQTLAVGEEKIIAERLRTVLAE